MTMRTLTMAVVAAAVCLHGPRAVRAADGTTIEPVEKWTDVFGGSEVTFHDTVRAAEPFEGRFDWSLSVDRRTLDRGGGAVKVEPEKPARVALPLRIPAVKNGVILEARLTVTVFAAGDPKPVAPVPSATSARLLAFAPPITPAAVVAVPPVMVIVLSVAPELMMLVPAPVVRLVVM